MQRIPKNSVLKQGDNYIVNDEYYISDAEFFASLDLGVLHELRRDSVSTGIFYKRLSLDRRLENPCYSIAAYTTPSYV